MKKILLLLFIYINSLFALEHLSVNNFDKKIANKNVIIHFYAKWCELCKMTTKNLHEHQSKNHNDVIIYSVNIAEEVELTKRFDALSIPFFVYYKNGRLLAKESGVKNMEQIENSIYKYFK